MAEIAKKTIMDSPEKISIAIVLHENEIISIM
jgi:hypothetical protein